MSNKREQKVISDVNVNEVPSLDKIKTKMDFSKHDFQEIKEVFYSESKLKQACFKTFLITFIICVISSIIVIRIDNMYYNGNNGILTKDEIEYIEDNSADFENTFIYSYMVDKNISFYLFKASDNLSKNIKYYYKIIGKFDNDFKIYINDEIIEITKDTNFGLLCTSSKIEIIEIVIEYNGKIKKFSFSN